MYGTDKWMITMTKQNRSLSDKEQRPNTTKPKLVNILKMFYYTHYINKKFKILSQKKNILQNCA